MGISAPKLCPKANEDPYSDKLNYYLGATFRQSSIFHGRFRPATPRRLLKRRNCSLRQKVH